MRLYIVLIGSNLQTVSIPLDIVLLVCCVLTATLFLVRRLQK